MLQLANTQLSNSVHSINELDYDCIQTLTNSITYESKDSFDIQCAKSVLNNNAKLLVFSSGTAVNTLNRSTNEIKTLFNAMTKIVEVIQSRNIKSSLVAALDESGSIYIHDISKESTFILKNSLDFNFLQLCWDINEDILAGIASNKSIFVWNYKTLINQFESKQVSIENSNAKQIQFENQPTCISFDYFSDLYIADTSKNIYRIEEETFLYNITMKYTNRNNFPKISSSISSIFGHDNFLFVVYQKDGILQAFQMKENELAVEVQIIHFHSGCKITFLQSILGKSILVISNDDCNFIRVLIFSVELECFSFFETCKLEEKSIQFHDFYFNDNNLDILCKVDGILVLYSIETKFDKLPIFDKEHIDPFTISIAYQNQIIPQHENLDNEEKEEQDQDEGLDEEDQEENLDNEEEEIEEEEEEEEEEEVQVEEEKSFSVDFIFTQMIRQYLFSYYERLMEEERAREAQFVDKLETAIIQFTLKELQRFLIKEIKLKVKQFTAELAEDLSKKIIEREMIRTLRTELFEYFTHILIPSVQQSFQVVFEHFNNLFNELLSKHMENFENLLESKNEFAGKLNVINQLCSTLQRKTNQMLIECQNE